MYFISLSFKIKGVSHTSKQTFRNAQSSQIHFL